MTTGSASRRDGIQCCYPVRVLSGLPVVSLRHNNSNSQENTVTVIAAEKMLVTMDRTSVRGWAIWLLIILLMVCGLTGQRRAVAGIFGFGATSGHLAKLEFQLKERFEPTSVAWSPNGRYIATGSTADRRIDIWDVAQQKIVRVLLQKYPSAFFHEITWSPNGRYLAFCDAPGVLRLYRTSDWGEAHVFSGPPGNAGCTQAAAPTRPRSRC